MKKVISGGFIFLGGVIMFSVGRLGYAHVSIQAQPMQLLQSLGGFAMVAGMILGAAGLKDDR